MVRGTRTRLMVILHPLIRKEVRLFFFAVALRECPLLRKFLRKTIGCSNGQLIVLFPIVLLSFIFSLFPSPRRELASIHLTAAGRPGSFLRFIEVHSGRQI